MCERGSEEEVEIQNQTNEREEVEEEKWGNMEKRDWDKASHTDFNTPLKLFIYRGEWFRGRAQIQRYVCGDIQWH